MQTRLRTGVEVLPATALADLGEIRPVAETVFGGRRHDTGWFTRKLTRECVDRERSVVAIQDSSVVGFVLVGSPASTRPFARAAGTGVIPPIRGLGLGSRLIREACEACLQLGDRGLELWATPSTEPFYTRLDFRPFEVRETFVATSCERRESTRLPRLDKTPHAGLNLAVSELGEAPKTAPTDEPYVEACRWLPEAWEKSEPATRQTLVIPGRDGPAMAWVTHDGLGTLVHRLLVHDAREPQTNLVHALRTLRKALSGIERPVFFPGVPASQREAFVRAGLLLGQRAVGLRWPPTSFARAASVVSRR